MRIVKVYSKEKCMQCKMVKNWLTAHSVEFTEIDVTHDEEALHELKSLGFTSLPVTYVDCDEYNGYIKGFDIVKLNQWLGEI